MAGTGSTPSRDKDCHGRPRASARAGSVRAVLTRILTCGLLCVACRGVQAQTWIGGGTTAAWTDAGNWNTVPDFSGTSTAHVLLGTGFTSGTATTLDGDKTINRLSATTSSPFSIGGDTLTIRSGSISLSTGSPIVTISSNVVLGANGVSASPASAGAHCWTSRV